MEFSSAVVNPLHSPLLFYPKSLIICRDRRTLQPTCTSTSSITATISNVPKCSKVRHTNGSLSYNQRQSLVSDVQQASDLGSALARLGGKLKVQDLNIILRHFGKLNRREKLSKLFDWMQTNGKISSSTYSSYIKFMGKGLNPAKVVEIYNSIGDESMKSNVPVCNSVLSCLVQSGKFETALQLFHQMKRGGLTPDAFTYSSLLAGCIKVKDGYTKAIELLEELLSNGLQIDSVIYGTLLAVCASNNQCRAAESYFSQMKDEGHSPNLYHYSSLLNAYAADGNFKKADLLLEELKTAGLVPNKVILTTMLKAYVRGRLFEKSKSLLADLEVAGHAEDEMPYCLLLDGLSKAGQMHEAKSLFEEMKTKNVKSDGYAYSIMISAFCRNGLFEEAKLLASEFEATYNTYDLVIMNTVLCAYCRAGDMESVMKTMKKMDALAITPDWNTFHILIKYFCKEKLYLLAYRTMEDMHRKGHQLNEELTSSLIYHLGKTGAYSEAFSVYTMLRYSKRTICKSLHEKILHILIKGRLLKDAYVVIKDNAELISEPAKKRFAISFMKFGNINLVNDVIKALHTSGYKIDQELFYMAITRYIEQPEKKELLLKLLQWMPGQGYVVDSSIRNLVLKNSNLFGRQLIAEILSKQHMVSRALSSSKRE